jgi:hypothetical protein
MANSPIPPRRRFYLHPVSDDRLIYSLCPVKEEDRCPQTFPRCPSIRCQKAIHIDTDQSCFATGRNPYFYVVWESRGQHKED